MAWGRLKTAGFAPAALLLMAGLLAACAAAPGGDGQTLALKPSASQNSPVVGTLPQIVSLPGLIADARKQMALNAPRNALGFLDTAVRLSAEEPTTQRAEVLSLRAEALLATGQPGRALADVDNAIAVKDDVAPYYVLKAAALIELKRPNDAVKALDRAIGLTPDRAQYYMFRAVIHLVIGNTDSALADIGAYGTRQGGMLDAFQRGLVHHLGRDYDSAVREYAAALAEDSNAEMPSGRTAVTRLMRGLAHHQAGNYSAAARDYGAVLAVRPGWDFVRGQRDRARKNIPLGPNVEA